MGHIATVLALDLSGIVGWCCGPADARSPKFGRWPLPEKCDQGEVWAAFQVTLRKAIKALDPDEIVLEAPMRLAALAQRSTLSVVAQQLTLRGICFVEAWQAGLDQPKEVSAETVRKTLLGQSRFPKGTVKDEVVRFCHGKGWRVPDHNAGDACLTWAYRAQQIARPKAARRKSDLLFNLEGAS